MNSSDIREPNTAKTVCSNKMKFQIPIYQRLFVWGKKEITKLLDDLDNAYRKNAEKPYYIGVITVQEQEDGTLEVVDGQQRLTFLTLFGCEMIQSNIDANWNNFVLNDFVLKEEDKLKIHYVGRQEDEKDIISFLENGIFNSNQNFKIFHECFEFFSKEKDISGLSKFVFEKTNFLVNYLPKEYEPLDLNLYFEKMNSTGIQLTPLEQLKGRFAQYAKNWNKCIYVDSIEDEKVKDLNSTASLADILNLDYDKIGIKADKIEAINKAPNTLKIKRRIIKPEIMVLHALCLLLGTDDVSLDERHLLETFDQKLDDSRKEEFIKILEDYSSWIDENIIHIKNEQDDSNNKDEQDDSNLPYSIGNIENNSNEERFIQYQSMLYVSGYDTQKWILDVYKKCGNGKIRLDLKILQEWDKNDNNNCNFDLINNWYYGRNLIQVFTRLEYCLWEYISYPDSNTPSYEIEFSKDEEEAIKNYVFQRNNYTVEHFHPQTDEKNSSNNSLWNAPYTEQSKKYNCNTPKDSFGNLALISAGRNSEYGNYSVASKYDRVTMLVQKKQMESIKLLFMCKACDGQDGKWTPDIAEQLAQWMYKLLEYKGYILKNNPT